MRFLAFLRALFRPRSSPSDNLTLSPVDSFARPPATEVIPSSPTASNVAYVGDEPFVEEDDEWWGSEEEDDPDAGPDPFISGAPIAFEFPADVEALRQQARIEALGREHKLPLFTPAGPGSLAEALNGLTAEGHVEAEFVDDAVEGPYMHYRPVRN